MKKITTLITLLILVGCNSMQTNIEVDSVDTFNLDNYSDFSIKINESSISAEINPIDLERFKDNLKTSLIETGLSCLLYTSPSPRDLSTSRMPSSA